MVQRSNWICVTLGFVGGCRTTPPAREAAPPVASAVESKAQSSVEDDWSEESVDLAPVEGRGYQLAVREFLLGDASARVSMVCTPSFSPEYLVAIVDPESADTAREQPARSPSVLTAAPTRQLWPHVEMRDLRCFQVNRFQAPIDEESAQLLCQAWESVVRRTRYPKPHYVLDENGKRCEGVALGADGTTYVFDTRRFRGEAWSPRGGLPARLVQFAEELRTLAQTDEAHRALQLARCLELARRLQDAAEKRPW